MRSYQILQISVGNATTLGVVAAAKTTITPAIKFQHFDVAPRCRG
jgi:hypothetical protein